MVTKTSQGENMKLAKLSLAAIVVAGLATSSFAADTLADAFKEGKVSGALQAYYFDYDTGATSADIFTTGLDLSYETARFNGFAFKATFQGTSSPFADSDGKAMFIGSMYGSGAQLSEAYISYAMKNTTALVGRMYLDTPLVASSGSRVTKEAFEGMAIINTDLPNTTLIAGYVQKFQSRTDRNGNIGEFTKSAATTIGTVPFEDGAYTLAVINKSVAGLTLTGAYADVIDIAEVMYAEASYEGKASNFTYGLAAQYYFSEVDGQDDTNLFGIKASLGMGAWGVYAAYSEADDAASVVAGLGNGADLAYTGSPLNSYSYGANTEAYKIGATYAIMKNANLGISYTVNDDGITESDFTALEADYAFEGALKGLSVAFIYEDQGKDFNGANEMRLNLNYKF
jgi:hypothetical protein